MELNVECLPPRGQARERERERGQRGRGQRKIGEIVCLSRIARPPPAARAIMCRARVVLVQAVQGREREADLALKRGSGQANAVAKTWDTARQVCTDKSSSMRKHFALKGVHNF